MQMTNSRWMIHFKTKKSTSFLYLLFLFLSFLPYLKKAILEKIRGK